MFFKNNNCWDNTRWTLKFSSPCYIPLQGIKMPQTSKSERNYTSM